MEKDWAICTTSERHDPPDGLHPVTGRILAARGISGPAAVAQFLKPSFVSMPDPFLLKGMEGAVARLSSARLSGEPVCVYGDYDVDGITSTALLVSFLTACGISASYFIPNRFDDGYGLNSESLKRIAAQGARLVVTVDCGISSLDEAQLCGELGVDLIITDHHAPRETVPAAYAVINPHQPGCPYPFKQLAGVGVAFNLAIALRQRLREEGVFSSGIEPDVREWLDLVALGTIADVVPLIGQNRLYAYQGLRRLSEAKRPGVVELKRVAGIRDRVGSGSVGFRLAPRLNAAGRLESAVPGVQLLLTADTGTAAAIAGELDAANSERQAVERSMLDEAVAMVESSGSYPECRSIVLASRSWHQGVVGIVASRLVERFHRPVILVALDEEGEGKGSGRSIPGFDLLSSISSCSRHLLRFGGHRHAAGVGLKAGSIEGFAEEFEQEALQRLGGRELVPQLAIDCQVEPGEVTAVLAGELKLLEPFGAGNPEPVLMMRSLRVAARSVVGDGHLRLTLTRGGHTFSAIAFRMADREIAACVDIAFFPEINSYNGSSRLQLKVRDIRPAVNDYAER